MNMITRMYAPLFRDYMIASKALAMWRHLDGQASYLRHAYKAAIECKNATNRKRSINMWQDRIVTLRWDLMNVVQSVANNNGTSFSTGQLLEVSDRYLEDGSTIERAITSVLGDVLGDMPVLTVVKVPGKRGRKADPNSPTAIARVAREARKIERIAQGLPTRGRPRKVDASTVASATKIAASLPSGILVDTREAYSGILGV